MQEQQTRQAPVAPPAPVQTVPVEPVVTAPPAASEVKLVIPDAKGVKTFKIAKSGINPSKLKESQQVTVPAGAQKDLKSLFKHLKDNIKLVE